MNEISEQTIKAHYYGDIVRILFVCSGIIMLVGLPALQGYIMLPTSISVTSIIALVVAAGYTSPGRKTSAGINVGISAGAFFLFEMYAVTSYEKYGLEKFFLSNITLGFVFLVALYFSVKTLRGFFINST